jgi:glycosyltransferase involved in cell wall biosynthesis
MKIAIVNKFFFLNGGQETVALEQMRLLEQAGIPVAFFAMHHPRNLARNPADYPWSKYFAEYADFSLKDPKPGVWEQLALARRFIVNRSAAERFGAFLDDFRPDVIHGHGIAHQLTYAILPEAAKRGIPVVQTLHDYQIVCPNYTLLKGDGTVCTDGCSLGNYWPCVQHRCVKSSRKASVLSALEMTYNRTWFDYTRWVQRLIAPSRFLAQTVIASGIPAEKVITIPNFLVDLEAITPRFDHDGYFLYVGRLSYEKGLMTLLEAFRQVPQATLHIIGDGALRESLEAYCAAHRLQNVSLLGHQERERTLEYIRNAAAVIVPSEWYENQPMTIIEAFACGTPVIASAMGGIPDMVTDGEHGFLFQAGDADALARIVCRWMSRPEQQADLGKQARSQALRQYHPDHHLHRLLAVYRSLCPAPGGNAPERTVSPMQPDVPQPKPSAMAGVSS